MGIDINITVPHGIADVSISTVTTTFRPLDDLFGEISRHYSQWFRFKHSTEAWRDVSEADYGRPYLFHAPAGFTFSFGPRPISISPAQGPRTI